ncbi:MAG: hypothetical protein BJ554DRAFT_2834 [Olpidium bornovanus]|uniref:S5 DRBM domain-containing protein n=1 Tax=Olpidium bornovanus TaxID=278681 RepID=A0A8H8DG00_9FUNG|nr:MAG: hypothetical protein BJ554DRAFT_2834 [Olpidium bornovanus]
MRASAAAAAAAAASASASARALRALSAAPAPAPARLLAGAGAPKWNVGESGALRGPARRPQATAPRGRTGRLTATASLAAVRLDSALVPARFSSTLSWERERDFNPTFVNDVFCGDSAVQTEEVPLPEHVRKSLSNPVGAEFPRVDQFDRFLDYTPYDDEAQGYPDLGVSFPRVRVPGKYNIPPKAEVPVEVLLETSGVNPGYYRGLYKRVIDVRYRRLHKNGMKTRLMCVHVIVGDCKGTAGLGVGVAPDVRTAVRLAYVNAYRQMESFYIYDNRTLHSGGEFMYQGFRMSAKARGPGFGKRVHHSFYDLCEAVGIRDVQARVKGTSNPQTVINAFFAFLRTQRPPRDVARARGLKMTDLMHAYYGRPQEL